MASTTTYTRRRDQNSRYRSLTPAVKPIKTQCSRSYTQSVAQQNHELSKHCSITSNRLGAKWLQDIASRADNGQLATKPHTVIVAFLHLIISDVPGGAGQIVERDRGRRIAVNVHPIVDAPLDRVRLVQRLQLRLRQRRDNWKEWKMSKSS